MNENRTASRRRVLKSALIVISEKAPRIKCAVKSISEIGAALQVSTTFGIPGNFERWRASALPFGLANRLEDRSFV